MKNKENDTLPGIGLINVLLTSQASKETDLQSGSSGQASANREKLLTELLTENSAVSSSLSPTPFFLFFFYKRYIFFLPGRILNWFASPGECRNTRSPPPPPLLARAVCKLNCAAGTVFWRLMGHSENGWHSFHFHHHPLHSAGSPPELVLAILGPEGCLQRWDE